MMALIRFVFVSETASLTDFSVSGDILEESEDGPDCEYFAVLLEVQPDSKRVVTTAMQNFSLCIVFSLVVSLVVKCLHRSYKTADLRCDTDVSEF